MPLNRYVVRVDPQGKTMDVDVLDTSGTSVPAFESSQFDAAARSLPLTISAPTDFWLQSPGPYDVSCKVATTEIASATGPQRVQVSDVPVLVVPPWEVLAPQSSGGSSAVYAGLEAGGDALPEGASTAITSWAIDEPIDGLTVDVDGTIHLPGDHVLGAALYQVRILCIVTGAGVTAVEIDQTATGVPFNGETNPFTISQAPNNALQEWLFLSGGAIQFSLNPTGGAGTLSYAGLDVIKLA